MKSMTRPAAALTVALVLAGCSASGDEPPAQAQVAATEVPEEAETETEEADQAPALEDGAWPESYSFELPEGLSLQEEVIDPAEAGDLFESAPSYRRLTFAGHGPLMVAPESLHRVPMSQEVLQQALEFGARLYVEEFIDSDLLMKEYTREAEREWFDGFRDQTTPELQEPFDARYDEPVGRGLLALSYSLFSLTEGADDGEDGASGSTDYVIFGPRHDEAGPRLANVQVSLTDGEHIRFDHGEVLELTYEGSQALLLSVSDDEDDPERQLVAMSIDSRVTLGLWNAGSGWTLSSIQPHFTSRLNDPAA